MIFTTRRNIRAIGAVMAVAVALSLTACGSGSTEKTVATFTLPVTSPSSPVATIPPAQPSPAPTEVQGPDDGVTTSPPTPDGNALIDQSSAAKNNFEGTWNYESELPSDLQHGVDNAYSLGLDACSKLLQGAEPPALVEHIHDINGYTFHGSQAILRAAAAWLCPGANHGYKTDFDAQVNYFQTEIYNKTGVYPDETKTGVTMKLVCNFLDQHGNDVGLTALMQSEGTPSNADIKFIVVRAVGNHCNTNDDKLGAYWYNVYAN